MHSTEYRGQWVALQGGSLLSNGSDARTVAMRRARRAPACPFCCTCPKIPDKLRLAGSDSLDRIHHDSHLYTQC
jgi:hypothetical protein